MFILLLRLLEKIAVNFQVAGTRQKVAEIAHLFAELGFKVAGNRQNVAESSGPNA
jgi:hypothetical protein